MAAVAEHCSYDTGIQTGEAELVRRKEQLESELRAQKEQWQKEYEDKFETMESELIDAITIVFNKVFKIQFEDKSIMEVDTSEKEK